MNTYSELLAANPFVTGPSDYNKTATAWINRKMNGNLNNRAKNYKWSDGRNTSGHHGKSGN